MKFSESLKGYFSALRVKPGKLMNESEVFCMAPWLQLHAQTNGEITPCCVSAYKGEAIGNLRENPNLADAWNSEKMKHIRLNMLEGKKSALCGNCYEDEHLGKFSERMKYNRDFKDYISRAIATQPDGSVKELNIPVIDIRFSNKCNYKCRICNSDNSSLLHEEEVKLGRIPSDAPKEVKAAADETAFWESFERLLPTVKRLHFAGGEPLVMDEHYRVLEHLISIGNTDVNLAYNTNFLTLRYKKYNVIDLWNQFRKVDVWASLDGMEQRGDYQRKGQRWNVIEENIRTLQRECTSVVFGIDATVSIFNVMHIPGFYQYMVENKFVEPDRMNLYHLHEPDYFCVTNLTPQLKHKAAGLYDNFISGYLQTLPDASKIKEHVAALIKFMQSEQKEKQAEFQNRINEVDALRNENFASIFPELAGMLAPATA